MLAASIIKYTLKFLKPAGTSRGVLHEKDSWFILLSDTDRPGIKGIGECSIIPGISIDRMENFEFELYTLSRNVSLIRPADLSFYDHPAIQFGLETALKDLNTGGERKLFPSDFTQGKRGIPINGLIWMGDKSFMKEQVKLKIDQGFRVLKLKVGAINFEDEMAILKSIREEFAKKELEIRLDANGAWEKDEAIRKLDLLSKFHIHSIEQPIAAGNAIEMADVVSKSAIPIALDEELPGHKLKYAKQVLLETIKPAYIILKPSLLGGFQLTEEWISIAEKLGIRWWVTSALESNIGLNAIAQWTATLNNDMPQGLGTGMIYSNNIPSPLILDGSMLFYNKNANWDLSNLNL